MTNDTLRSLGLLEKSLTLNKRAVQKNMAADGVMQPELDVYLSKVDELMAAITNYKAIGGSSAAASVVAQGIAGNPDPASLLSNP